MPARLPDIFGVSNRVACIVLMVCLIALPTMGTTIIAVRTANFVIIATDSKATYIGTSGAPTVCKIYNDGQLYFAVAGLDGDARRNFSVKSIVARSLSASGNFEEQVTRVENAISQSLLVELNHLQREDPGVYAFTMHNSREVVSIVLAQYQGGVPHLAARGFAWTMNPSPGIAISRVTCPGDCSDGRELVSLGQKNAAERFMRANAGEDFDLPALAVKLVQLEIDETPGNVGPPINELRLDKGGAVWLSNSAGCPVPAR